MNISSAVIHARPGGAETLRARLSAVEGVEVHAVSPEGRLIVTIEAESDRATVATCESIERMSEVMSLALVYHQVEPDPDTDFSIGTAPGSEKTSERPGQPDTQTKEIRNESDTA